MQQTKYFNLQQVYQGSIKNNHLVTEGGGELIHILTFWGRLIQFFPLTRVKVDIFQIYSEQF